jgi:hypothetical protein
MLCSMMTTVTPLTGWTGRCRAAADLLAVEAGGRLVEQQDAGRRAIARAISTRRWVP